MRIEFSEAFALPIEEVFSYFESPLAWPKLYGLAGTVKDHGEGWYSIPLKNFPFPLVAKATEVQANALVRWIFRGFWAGQGQVCFRSEAGKVIVEGYEEIGLRYLPLGKRLVERLILEPQFKAVWAIGWKRLRKREQKS